MKVVATMATFGKRLERSNAAAVRAIAAQVNCLHVYCNGYDAVPKCLAGLGNVEATPSAKAAGDIMDAGKFYYDIPEGTLHVTVDDDFAYPPDYVATLRAGIDRYHGEAIVGIMGVLYPTKVVTDPYKSNRLIWLPAHGLNTDRVVHLLGTGTMAYARGLLPLDRKEWPLGRMPDVGVAVAAQRHCVPMVALRRTGGWLRPLSCGEEAPLYKRNRADPHALKVRSEYMQQMNPWRLWQPKTS